MFTTLETYHFGKLPQSLKDKAEKMIDDICPLGILYEGTIDAIDVWGRDDILLLMQAMYNEAEKQIKEQMMEDAVNGEVVKTLDGSLRVSSYIFKRDGFKFGDKVKIIIVKED